MYSKWDGRSQISGPHLCDLQTRRTIINPERFLYSRANMNPNSIEEENRLHVF